VVCATGFSAMRVAQCVCVIWAAWLLDATSWCAC
jgi:hypothetical protein